jgi:type III pantothenate kinase
MSDRASTSLPPELDVTGLRLAVLLGNTTCRIAMMDGIECVEELRFSHGELSDLMSAWMLRDICRDRVPKEAVMCSVVPSLEAEVEVLFEAAELPVPRRVLPAESAFFPTRYRSMDTLGADRYCGALAARLLYGAPAIVVDCGTATTVGVVDADGSFLGGAIAPGVETALRTLHARTAQLPSVDLAREVPLIGTDTEESMRSGAVHFSRHAVEGVVRELKKNTGDSTPLILTGGNAPVLLGAGLLAEPLVHDEKLCFRGSIFHLLLTTRAEYICFPSE